MRYSPSDIGQRPRHGRSIRRSITIILLSAVPAWSVAPKREYYVFNVKPLSVSVVDSDSLEIVGSTLYTPVLATH